MTAGKELQRAVEFQQRLEDLVVSRKACPHDTDRDLVLVGYWSLLFDYNKSILSLLSNNFPGGAFALSRPVVEALVRAHVALMGSNEDVNKIKNDEYRVNFKTIGDEIDTAFALEGFFDKFLNGAKGALHSFTHSGLSQLGRRFQGDNLGANYGDEEIVELIHVSCSAAWMVTNLVTKHFKFEPESKTAQELFLEWGKH